MNEEKVKEIRKHTLNLLNQLDNHENDKKKMGQDWIKWESKISSLFPTVEATTNKELEESMARYIMSYGKLSEPLDCLILAHELIDEFKLVVDKPTVEADGDRLLTNKQFSELHDKFFGEGSGDACEEIDDTDLCYHVAKAQDTKTASIKDAEIAELKENYRCLSKLAFMKDEKIEKLEGMIAEYNGKIEAALALQKVCDEAHGQEIASAVKAEQNRIWLGMKGFDKIPSDSQEFANKMRDLVYKNPDKEQE